MDDNNQDKMKIKEILDEINNLRKYSSDLANNIRGEKLENYVDNLNKSITLLENKVETIYDKNI